MRVSVKLKNGSIRYYDTQELVKNPVLLDDLRKKSSDKIPVIQKDGTIATWDVANTDASKLDKIQKNAKDYKIDTKPIPGGTPKRDFKSKTPTAKPSKITEGGTIQKEKPGFFQELSKDIGPIAQAMTPLPGVSLEEQVGLAAAAPKHIKNIVVSTAAGVDNAAVNFGKNLGKAVLVAGTAPTNGLIPYVPMAFDKKTFDIQQRNQQVAIQTARRGFAKIDQLAKPTQDYLKKNMSNEAAGQIGGFIFDAIVFAKGTGLLGESSALSSAFENRVAQAGKEALAMGMTPAEQANYIRQAGVRFLKERVKDEIAIGAAGGGAGTALISENKTPEEFAASAVGGTIAGATIAPLPVVVFGAKELLSTKAPYGLTRSITGSLLQLLENHFSDNATIIKGFSELLPNEDANSLRLKMTQKFNLPVQDIDQPKLIQELYNMAPDNVKRKINVQGTAFFNDKNAGQNLVEDAIKSVDLKVTKQIDNDLVESVNTSAEAADLLGIEPKGFKYSDKAAAEYFQGNPSKLAKETFNRNKMEESVLKQLLLTEMPEELKPLWKEEFKKTLQQAYNENELPTYIKNIVGEDGIKQLGEDWSSKIDLYSKANPDFWLEQDLYKLSKANPEIKRMIEATIDKAFLPKDGEPIRSVFPFVKEEYQRGFTDKFGATITSGQRKIKATLLSQGEDSPFDMASFKARNPMTWMLIDGERNGTIARLKTNGTLDNFLHGQPNPDLGVAYFMEKPFELVSPASRKALTNTEMYASITEENAAKFREWVDNQTNSFFRNSLSADGRARNRGKMISNWVSPYHSVAHPELMYKSDIVDVPERFQRTRNYELARDVSPMQEAAQLKKYEEMVNWLGKEFSEGRNPDLVSDYANDVANYALYMQSYERQWNKSSDDILRRLSLEGDIEKYIPVKGIDDVAAIEELGEEGAAEIVAAIDALSKPPYIDRVFSPIEKKLIFKKIMEQNHNEIQLDSDLVSDSVANTSKAFFESYRSNDPAYQRQVQESAQKFSKEIADEPTRILVDGYNGVSPITQEQAKILRVNEHYVPSNREITNFDSASGSNSSVMKRRSGSVLDIKSPLWNVVANSGDAAGYVIRNSEIANTMKFMAESGITPWQSYSKVSLFDNPEGVAKMNFNQAFGLYGDNGLEISWIENGVRHTVSGVDPFFYNAFKTNPEQIFGNGKLNTAMKWATQTKRELVTKWPRFGIGNWRRDIKGSAFNFNATKTDPVSAALEAWGNYYGSIAKTPDAIRRIYSVRGGADEGLLTQLQEKFNVLGSETLTRAAGTREDYLRDAFKEIFPKLVTEEPVSKTRAALQRGWDGYSRAVQATELSTRTINADRAAKQVENMWEAWDRLPAATRSQIISDVNKWDAGEISTGEFNSKWNGKIQRGTIANPDMILSFQRLGKDETVLRYANNAFRNTTGNFSEKGTSAATYGQYKAFMTASIAGARAEYNAAVGQGWKNTIVKGTALFTIPTIIEYYMNRDNPAYQQLTLNEKLRYYHIPIGGGKFLRDPVGYGAIPATFRDIPLAALIMIDDYNKAQFGEENAKVLMDQIIQNIVTSSSPIDVNNMTLGSLSPDIISPIVDVAINQDFRGQEIDPQKKWGIPASQRTTPSSGVTADKITELGGQLGINVLSAPQLKYLANGYFATAGEQAFNISDFALNEMGVGNPPAQTEDKSIRTAPMVGGLYSRFVTVPPEETYYNDDFVAYRNITKEIEKVNRTYQDYMKVSPEKAMNYYANNVDAIITYEATSSSRNKIINDMKEINKIKSDVMLDPTIKAQQINQKITEIQIELGAIREQYQIYYDRRY